MKYFYCCVVIVLSFTACIPERKNIGVWIENSSDRYDSLEILTYFADSLVDKRLIVRDSIADRIRTFNVEIGTSDQTQFRFRSNTHNSEIRYTVHRDSLKPKSILHVNLVEKRIHGELKIDSTHSLSIMFQPINFYAEIITLP